MVRKDGILNLKAQAVPLWVTATEVRHALVGGDGNGSAARSGGTEGSEGQSS